jgi:hypothetical protein
MEYMVAFVNLHDRQLALVEVKREMLQDGLHQKQVQEQLAKVPELKGYAIVLAVPADGQFEAGFRTTPDIQLALKKIGWPQLGFRPTTSSNTCWLAAGRAFHRNAYSSMYRCKCFRLIW